MVGSLPLMPEWYLLISVLISVALLGIVWKPLLITAPFALAAILLSAANAAVGASSARFNTSSSSAFEMVRRRCLTWLLHLIQPIARLSGRLSLIGSQPVTAPFVFPRKRSSATWTTNWQDPAERLSEVKRRLDQEGTVVQNGGAYDPWDLEVFGGMLGSARMLMAVEDHGAGSQLVRIRSWPRLRHGITTLLLILACLTLLGGWSGQWIIGSAFGALLILLLSAATRQAGRATALLLQSIFPSTN